MSTTPRTYQDGHVFRIGEGVEFEISEDNNPRWDQNRDCGGIGKCKQGVVIEVYLSHGMIRVSEIDDDTGCANGYCWLWPINHNHEHYSPDQWSRPGYLRPYSGCVNQEKTEISQELVCTCKSMLTGVDKDCPYHNRKR